MVPELASSATGITAVRCVVSTNVVARSVCVVQGAGVTWQASATICALKMLPLAAVRVIVVAAAPATTCAGDTAAGAVGLGNVTVNVTLPEQVFDAGQGGVVCAALGRLMTQTKSKASSVFFIFSPFLIRSELLNAKTEFHAAGDAGHQPAVAENERYAFVLAFPALFGDQRHDPDRQHRADRHDRLAAAIFADALFHVALVAVLETGHVHRSRAERRAFHQQKPLVVLRPFDRMRPGLRRKCYNGEKE